MRISELLRLVWMNINQNKFKSILTSIGIVAGAATIVLVIGIGRGGQMEVAEQFAELNAGAIDISYEYEGEQEKSGGGFSFGNAEQFFRNVFGGERGTGLRENTDTGGSSDPRENAGTQDGFNAGDNAGPGGDFNAGGNAGPGGDFNAGDNAGPGDDSDRGEGDGHRVEPGQEQDTADRKERQEEAEEDKGENTEDIQQEEEQETSMIDERLNQENFLLTQDDVDDIEKYVTGITGATISYSTKASVEGGNLQTSQTCTVAGVKECFLEISKLEMSEGEFLTETDDQSKARVCILGATTAKELFGSAVSASGNTIYIDDRTYTVAGVLQSSQTVSAGISPDTTIMIPYETGIKYITGTDIEPVLTVIAQDVNVLDNVIEDVRTVLQERHVNSRFTFEDSGSKMQAAQSSNRTLTMLLSAMAVIVFLVGGIGIMNVLFVSVKERTNEIGILKAIGTSQSNILIEFLIESAAISFIGGVLGVAVSFMIIPVARWMDVRVEVGVSACLAALGFAVLTGTVFGIYPAWRASRLEPVEALNAE